MKNEILYFLKNDAIGYIWCTIFLCIGFWLAHLYYSPALNTCNNELNSYNPIIKATQDYKALQKQEKFLNNTVATIDSQLTTTLQGMQTAQATINSFLNN